jgi:hypothetical protein
MRRALSLPPLENSVLPDTVGFALRQNKKERRPRTPLFRLLRLIEASLLGCAARCRFARFASLGFLLGFEVLAGLLVDDLH